MTPEEYSNNQRAREIIRDVQFYDQMVRRFQTRELWQSWLSTPEAIIESLREPRLLTWPIDRFTITDVKDAIDQFRKRQR